MLAGISIIVSAVYMLNLFKRVFLGVIMNPKNNELCDINIREKLLLIPLAIVIVLFGIYPSVILDKVKICK